LSWQVSSGLPSASELIVGPPVDANAIFTSRDARGDVESLHAASASSVAAIARDDRRRMIIGDITAPWSRGEAAALLRDEEDALLAERERSSGRIRPHLLVRANIDGVRDRRTMAIRPFDCRVDCTLRRRGSRHRRYDLPARPTRLAYRSNDWISRRCTNQLAIPCEGPSRQVVRARRAAKRWPGRKPPAYRLPAITALPMRGWLPTQVVP